MYAIRSYYGISLLASMLGLGGAVMLIPALLYLPPLFGLAPFGAAAVSGMTPLLSYNFV